MTTTVKVKFRPSSVAERPGTIVYLVTHRRIVRQITTDYKLYPNEWDESKSTVIETNNKDICNERKEVVVLVGMRLRQDIERLNIVIKDLNSKGIVYTSDDVVASYNKLLVSIHDHAS